MACIFFYFHEIRKAFFHEISVVLNNCIVCCFQDFERSSNCLLYDIKRECSKNCSECVQVLRGGEAVGSQYVTRTRVGSDSGPDRSEQGHCSENPIQED